MDQPRPAAGPSSVPRSAGDPLFVPVRRGPDGCAGARLFRTPVGHRTAVGFTSERRLTAALGPAQPWLRLSEPALRALASPLGVGSVTVDPLQVGRAVRGPVTAEGPLMTAGPVGGRGPATIRDFFPVQTQAPEREPQGTAAGALGAGSGSLPKPRPEQGPGLEPVRTSTVNTATEAAR
ncbi:SAV_915 family protein [Streptomyces sp. NBC_01795]|uniref:SAV_915 family protein n=1 Tax=Streptomyces sp. NBC_01795 TaxID=2975943 RepID=UPI003FA36B8F